MNGTGSREANEVTLMTKPSRALACGERELHQLDLTENQNLKLARNCFHGKELSSVK